MFGHVSFVIDGFSYSFDAEGYHRDDPATFFKEESKAGGGTAYILNFGRRTLNDAFKVAIERGYSSNEIYTGLTNRSTACGSAMNTISSALNLRYDFAMTPKGQENYIKANLQRYIVGDPIRIPMSGPKEASGGGIIPTRDRPCGYRKDC